MKTRLIAALLLSAAPVHSLVAQDATAVPAAAMPADVPDMDVPALADPSAEQISANEAAKALGMQIYRHDQAAWHGSDALAGEIKFEDHPEIRDYLTEELPDNRIALIYYAEKDGANYEFARMEVEGTAVSNGVIHPDMTQHPLSPTLERQAKARQAALEQGMKEKLTLCTGGSANIVSLPADESGQIAVYITSSQEFPYQFPLGGHYLLTVNSENTVVSGRAFMPGCFDVPIINEHIQDRPDNYSFAHVLDEQPNEMHYFVAQNVNLPLSITAGNVLWTVARSQPVEVQRDASGAD